MELIAVLTHVEDIERPHRRPAVLVAESERDEAVRLHLLGQGDELVEGLGDRVALLLEEALAVDDDPRVVVHRDEVLLSVVAGRGLLECVRVVVANLGPHVGDWRREALGGEEPHPVPGEPGEDVVGSALEIGVDLVLELAVLDGVDRRLRPSLAVAVLDHRGEGSLGRVIGVVRADRHRATSRSGACRAGAGAGSFGRRGARCRRATATRTGRDQEGQGGERGRSLRQPRG